MTLWPSLDRLVEKHFGIGYERRDLCRHPGVFLIHLLGIEGIGAEECVGDRILFVAGVLDVGAKQRRVEQVDDPQPAARHFVFVRRPNAAAGGADLLPPWCAFGREFDHAVIGQNHLGAVGDEKLPVDVDAQFAKLADLLEKRHRVKHDAVADDAAAIGPQHTTGNQLEDKFLTANDDGVSGIVAARVARDDA